MLRGQVVGAQGEATISFLRTLNIFFYLDGGMAQNNFHYNMDLNSCQCLTYLGNEYYNF